MGYTHYWYREKEIDGDIYRAIVDDFKKLLPAFGAEGVKLAGGSGEGEPRIDYDEVWFNGASHCGHPPNHNIVIPWPSKKAVGVGASAEAISGQWFAGAEIETRCCDGDCSYETFDFPRIITEREPIGEVCYYNMAREPVYNEKAKVGRYFHCCKTAFRPYDWAVTAFLVIAKHYLGDKIIVHSDGEVPQWQDAMLLCQIELGYGMDFQLD